MQGACPGTAHAVLLENTLQRQARNEGSGRILLMPSRAQNPGAVGKAQSWRAPFRQIGVHTFFSPAQRVVLLLASTTLLAPESCGSASARPA